MAEKSLNEQKLESTNRDLEIALIKIARVLYDFVDSQEDAEAITDIAPLIGEFQNSANDYVNRTGRLHPDLGLELREWATFKRELLSPDYEQQKSEGRSNLDRRFVDDYGKTPEAIIKNLEQELGLGR